MPTPNQNVCMNLQFTLSVTYFGMVMACPSRYIRTDKKNTCKSLANTVINLVRCMSNPVSYAIRTIYMRRIGGCKCGSDDRTVAHKPRDSFRSLWHRFVNNSHVYVLFPIIDSDGLFPVRGAFWNLVAFGI